MGFLLLVPGLVLWLAGDHWFSNVHKVGLILTIVGAVVILLQAIGMSAILRRW